MGLGLTPPLIIYDVSDFRCVDDGGQYKRGRGMGHSLHAYNTDGTRTHPSPSLFMMFHSDFRCVDDGGQYKRGRGMGHSLHAYNTDGTRPCHLQILQVHCTHYSGSTTCLVSFVWASPSCEQREVSEKFEMKTYAFKQYLFQNNCIIHTYMINTGIGFDNKIILLYWLCCRRKHPYFTNISPLNYEMVTKLAYQSWSLMEQET